jgi:2-polyprenyl-3-methyl-5-hydroxy-6-metoxy-1,4-benzoquinol methylase
VAESTRAFYDRLAADYHLLYEDWPAAIRRQAASLDRLIRGALGAAARDVLDCACGIGTQALGLAELGYRVSAIDLSPEAIARATREAQARRLDIAFQVADMRALERAVPGRFDVVLAADNVLPHLLTDQDLAAALQAIAQKLTPDGLFLASIRDYDDALVRRPVTWPARLFGAEGQRRIVQQVWEWLDQRRYRVHIFVTRQSEGVWRCDHHVALYRALARSELTAAIEAAGLGAVRWLTPEQSGFHQPLVLARTAAAQDGAACLPAGRG